MKLQKGMRVFGNIKGISDQIAINTGVHEVLEYKGLKYFEDSFIPLDTWRILTSSESKRLIETEAKFSNYSKNLYIGEISEKLKNAFNLLDLKSCVTPDEIYPRFEDNKTHVKKINKELHAFLKKCSSTGNFKFHKITRAVANMETMTSFYVDKSFLHLGMHIDQSTHFKIHTAHKSGNRISINLSNETRTLLFTNLTMIQVYNLIGKKIDVKKTQLNPDNISAYFFKHYPNYPVIKLRIKPYQYYVAPTDNFFHDASTAGNKQLDITLIYTGLFDQLP